MANIIRRGQVARENWPRLDEPALRELAQRAGASRPENGGHPVTGILVPLALWRSQRSLCAALGVETGILVREDDDPADVASEFAHVAVLAIEFPKFTNGRGYSMARLLRARYGYRGELRAVGDVLRDQLFYMARVGFDAFELRADQDAQQALRAFSDFTQCYQASTDQPLPLFRRRAA
jgi:uncharacterized protein (DUF934 family)